MPLITQMHARAQWAHMHNAGHIVRRYEMGGPSQLAGVEVVWRGTGRCRARQMTHRVLDVRYIRVWMEATAVHRHSSLPWQG